MTNFFQFFFKRLAFNLKAANGKGHGVHSPFVFRFITEILNDNRFFYSYETIENNKKIFQITTNKLTNKKHVASIDSMLKCLPESKYHQLLFKIVHYYNPDNILEIGSSLGITTAYLSLANENNCITSLVETPIQHLLSNENLKETEVKNATVIHSTDLNLSITDIAIKKYGLILFNMSQINHEINIKDIFRILNEDSIIIFFSKNENFKPNHFWDEIISYQHKTISIKLLSLRIVFFRKEQYQNECYTIQF